jgi:glycoprotein endo-alpha-1,2-mannosidase
MLARTSFGARLISALFTVWAVSGRVATCESGVQLQREEHDHDPMHHLRNFPALKLDDDVGDSNPSAAREEESDVMAFYYLWYGNPETDGRYMHWNHSVLPHWTAAVNERYPNVGKPHEPPGRIHAKFYPARGCYSVADPATLDAQMTELHRAGVGTVVLSWWGRPGLSAGDSQGVVTDDKIAGVLRAAAAAGVFVAWHMEPYEGRSAATFREDVRYLNARYGDHPALLRRIQPSSRGAVKTRSPAGPVYFVYDSYHIPPADWAAVLRPPDSSASSSLSIRGTIDDGTFIGLWLDASHGPDLATGCFDGAYTCAHQI